MYVCILSAVGAAAAGGPGRRGRGGAGWVGGGVGDGRGLAVRGAGRQARPAPAQAPRQAARPRAPAARAAPARPLSPTTTRLASRRAGLEVAPPSELPTSNLSIGTNLP